MRTDAEELSRGLAPSLRRRDYLRKAIAEEKKNLLHAEERLRSALGARLLVQEVAKSVQRVAFERISSVVTKCLADVFDDPYEFRLTFEVKRNRTEAIISFARGGRELDPLSASGGGVVDVAAFALRLSCLVLSRPRRRKLLVLDEPFKMLSADHSGRVAKLILSLADELGVQFVIVTHNRNLRVGKVVELG